MSLSRGSMREPSKPLQSDAGFELHSTGRLCFELLPVFDWLASFPRRRRSQIGIYAAFKAVAEPFFSFF